MLQMVDDVANVREIRFGKIVGQCGPLRLVQESVISRVHLCPKYGTLSEMACSPVLRIRATAAMLEVRSTSSIPLVMIQITQKAGPASFAAVMNGYSNCRDSEHERADRNTHAILVQGSLLSYSPVAAH